jgi:hypothetical protein
MQHGHFQFQILLGVVVSLRSQLVGLMVFHHVHLVVVVFHHVHHHHQLVVVDLEVSQIVNHSKQPPKLIIKFEFELQPLHQLI